MKVLLTGGTGQVGWELARILPQVGEVIAVGRDRMDLTDHDSIRNVIRTVLPDVIVNGAGYARVDAVESKPALAMQVNGIAPGIIAEEARRIGAFLIHYSTAHVFDGTGTRPYREDDPPGPINEYGRTKVAGEQAIAACGGRYLILRTSWVYGLHGVNFLTTILDLARRRPELGVVQDQLGNPTWTKTVAWATLELLKRFEDVRGDARVLHVAATGSASRYDLAREIVALARQVLDSGAKWATVQPIATSDYPLPAPRPGYSVLDSGLIHRSLGIQLPQWNAELLDCLHELAQAGGSANTLS